MEIDTRSPEFHDLFPAVVTGVEDSPDGYAHSWVSLQPDGTGNYTIALPARTGGPGYGAAYELNNRPVDVGTQVLLRLRGTAGGVPVYDLIATGGGSSGSGTLGDCNGGLARLQTTDCLTVTATPGGTTGTGVGPVVTGIPFDGSRWNSDPFKLSYPGGSGVVEFWYADGQLHLGIYLPAVGSAPPVLGELLPCGDGCFQGGPLTGHPATHGAGACAGDTFTVCVECTPCPTVDCGGGGLSACPSNELPTRLYLTFSASGEGSPVFVDEVVELNYTTYDDNLQDAYGSGIFFGASYGCKWDGSVFTCTDPPSGGYPSTFTEHFFSLVLDQYTSLIYLRHHIRNPDPVLGSTSGYGYAIPVSYACDPFEATFGTITDDGNTYPFNLSFSGTITE